MKVNDYSVNYYLNKGQRYALHNLWHDDSIVTKVADKSNGMLNCDTVYHLLEYQKQPSDEKVYEKVKRILLEKVTKWINSNFTKNGPQ